EGIVRYAHRAIAGLTFRPVKELIGELEKITS
ncbi:MAG: peroxiredoxin, partial [Acidimicrobiales bacterium]